MHTHLDETLDPEGTVPRSSRPTHEAPDPAGRRWTPSHGHARARRRHGPRSRAPAVEPPEAVEPTEGVEGASDAPAADDERESDEAAEADEERATRPPSPRPWPSPPSRRPSPS